MSVDSESLNVERSTLNVQRSGFGFRLWSRLAACTVVLMLGLYAVPAFAQEPAALSAPQIIQPAQDPTALAPLPGQAAPSTHVTSETARTPLRLNIALDGAERPAELSVAVQIVLLMTLLSVAPSLVLLMTSFTRIVIVLGFVRTALGVPSAPSNQIIVGLSLFLTFFIMGPTIDRIHSEALRPYLDGKIQSQEALEKATTPLREFMLKQTRTRNLEYFLELGGYGPTAVKDLPMRVVIPAFVLSELQSAFQMGFLLFLPFLVVDFLVSSVLMSLGMMMMPPNVVSLPFKLLLFVLVDGWHLIVQSLVQSFG
jgi:flagellar biosynthetic protein FliP